MLFPLEIELLTKSGRLQFHGSRCWKNEMWWNDRQEKKKLFYQVFLEHVVKITNFGKFS